MAELRALSVETFSGRVGEPFALSDGADGALTLRLTEVRSFGEPPAPELRAPFSIVFTGPAQPILPQRVYHLTHDHLGALEIFLVPIQPEADGARYQAVFN